MMLPDCLPDVMSDIITIILSSCLTILGGILLFLFGQAVTKGVIEPYVSYRQVLSKLAYELIFYADHIHSAPQGSEPEKDKEVSATVRSLSAELKSSIVAMPKIGLKLLRFCNGVPSQKDVEDAAGLLMRVSNNVRSKKDHIQISKDIQKAKKLLRIEA